MKRREGYILRNIGKAYVIVPMSGNTINLKEMLTLNETGAFLWEQMKTEKTEEELLEAVLLEYEVDPETASADIGEFLKKVKSMGMISAGV